MGLISLVTAGEAALAARTAVGLQEATRIPSSSLTALNHRAKTEARLPDGVVVVVDEASMVGTRQLAILSDHVEQAGGKLILIGDVHQLPQIEAGGIFHTWSTDSQQSSYTKTFARNNLGSGQPSMSYATGRQLLVGLVLLLPALL